MMILLDADEKKSEWGNMEAGKLVGFYLKLTTLPRAMRAFRPSENWKPHSADWLEYSG